ncbi:MAG TPA: hypothetical protein VGG10_07070 [Rhizomicrobium sp.]|jgi:hypothetical protein
MLGHLVQTHTDDMRALPRVNMLRWLNRMVTALLQRQAQPR